MRLYDSISVRIRNERTRVTFKVCYSPWILRPACTLRKSSHGILVPARVLCRFLDSGHSFGVESRHRAVKTNHNRCGCEV